MPSAEVNAVIRQWLDTDSFDRPTEAVAAIAERQRRMLLQQQPLAAWALAEQFEQSSRLSSVELPDGEPVVPGWMCGLALFVIDRRAHLVDVNADTLIHHLHQLNSKSRYLQRFFFSWLAVGLLEDRGRFSRELAQRVPEQLLARDWMSSHPFYGFLRQYVLDPRASESRLQIDSRRPREEVIRERDSWLSRAENLVASSRDAAYQNAMVKRYWRRLVRPDGPVRSLMEEVEKGESPEQWPEPNALAEQVEPWDDIVSNYRRNILHRLENFLEALRSFSRLRESLGDEGARDASTTLRIEDVVEAVEEGSEECRRLEASRDPSARPVGRIVTRLEDFEEA